MSIFLENVLVIAKAYALVTLPFANNTIWSKLPNLKIGDNFIYMGTEPDGRCLFKHIQTGEQYLLGSYLFLNSSRFYYLGKDKKTPRTALLVCSDTLLYPLESNSKSNRIQVKTGVIFDSFEENDKYCIVKTNNGTSYRIYKPSFILIADLDFKPITIVEDKVKAKKQTLAVAAEDKSSFDLEIIQTYKVGNIEFTNQIDAQVAQQVLKSLVSLETHVFKTQKDVVNLEQALSEIVLKLTSAK